MKLINSFFEIIEQKPGIEGIYKQIELAGRTCYSEDTEVLTNKGWKFFPEVNANDLVLSYNPTFNTLVWDNPNMIVKNITDNMVEIDHPNIKLCVTKDHRILQSLSTERKYSFLTAEQLLGTVPISKSKQSRFRIPKYFIGSKRIDIEIPTIKYTKEVKHGFRKSTWETVEFTVSPAFMVIAGAFISEGHTNHREKYGGGSNCQITQSSNNKLYKNVINALETLNWKYNVSSDSRKPYIKWITFGNSVLVELFDFLFGRGSRNKHLPEWFRKLPDEYLQILLENLYLGDGSHSTTRKERYLSISKRLLDEIQEVFILLGKNASYTFDSMDSRKCSLEESTRDSWVVDRKKHIKLTESKECTVYCTSTKSGIICVRYKGKTCWCGNCYKSESNITENSAKNFVDRMIKSGHGAMLEHGTVYLKIPINIDEAANFIDDNFTWTKYHLVEEKTGNWWAITTNYRRIIECGLEHTLQYLCEPTEFHEKRVTVRFITDQGILREFSRHRVFSFGVESTRYCNYSKDKFNNELTFIIPPWTKHITEGKAYWYDGICYRSGVTDNNVFGTYSWTKPSENEDINAWFAERKFIEQCDNTERYYFDLLACGWKPQQARNILPLATKCEIIMTGFVSDWKHFFNLRYFGTTGVPHPQAKELAEPLYNEFVARGYVQNN